MTYENSFMTMVVEKVRDEAAGVVALTLRRDDGAALPPWDPGAHVDVMLDEGGASGEPMVRQYSLCPSADERSWRIAVLREIDGRGGSTWVHDHVSAGDTLRVATTRNSFPFDPSASGERHVFVAGGIGITPLLAMVEAAAAASADWTLLYLVSSRERAAFADELNALGPRVKIHDRVLAGPLHLADALDELGADDARVYACGPARMLAAVEDYAASHTGCTLALERFATGTPAAPGDAADAVGSAETGTSFIVETADGTEVSVAGDETILAALRRCGIAALSSCEEGICGTCETPVIEGEPDHRDQLLSDEEREANETMMICVSRCKGDRLVLDL